MSITATIEHGQVVLPPGVNWPDGTILRIEPMKAEVPTAKKEIPTIWEVLKEFDGVADDLPADFAENHDHYIHGHPKK